MLQRKKKEILSSHEKNRRAGKAFTILDNCRVVLLHGEVIMWGDKVFKEWSLRDRHDYLLYETKHT